MKREIEEIERDLNSCTVEQIALSAKRCILEKELLIVLRGTQFYCSDCGRKSTLGKWMFIQALYNEPSHGGTEEDSWQMRPANECGIRCPKCKGYFYIPRLTHHRGKLLKIMEKVGPTQFNNLFYNAEHVYMTEKDLLDLCK